MCSTNTQFPAIWNKIRSAKESFYSKDNMLCERLFKELFNLFW